MLPSISIIVTCKGRLSYLERTIDTMINQDYLGPFEIIIVDYECPDGVGDWALAKGLKVVKATNAAMFNMSRARNLGGCASRSQILAFCDSHNLLMPNYLTQVEEALTMVDLVYPDQKMGSSAFRRSLFHAQRGYDESLTVYGWDDVDFYHRVEAAGYIIKMLPTNLIDVIYHTDEEKLRFYPNKDLWDSIAINKKACENPHRPVNISGYGV